MLEGACSRLRSLHVPGDPLILPNAWDAASARAVVEAGFPAVATTSAGGAVTLGYEDHERAPAAEMLAAAARIARAVEVPVTVDAEAGYGMEPDELVEALEAAGAAGCNLEDTDHRSERLRDPGDQAERLAAIRRAADGRGYGLVINARVDVFLADPDAEQGALVGRAAERARAYRDAGADCVYPILLHDEPTIGDFVDAVGAPVNVLAMPQAPSLERLAELGVARVSYGPYVHRRSMQHLATILAEIAGEVAGGQGQHG